MASDCMNHARLHEPRKRLRLLEMGFTSVSINQDTERVKIIELKWPVARAPAARQRTTPKGVISESRSELPLRLHNMAHTQHR